MMCIVTSMAGEPPRIARVNRFFSGTRRPCVRACFLSYTVTAAAIRLITPRYRTIPVGCEKISSNIFVLSFLSNFLLK